MVRILAETIERRSVEALVPYAKNSRTHSEAQVAQLAAAIREFGFTNPVLIDERGGIIAGHGRVMAARSAGMVEIPCIVLAGLSDAQRRAYVIADNKLALNAGWDEELLSAEIEVLVSLGVETNLLGFNEEEVASLLQDDGHNEGDKEPRGEKKIAEGINYQVVAQCASESEQAQLITRLENEGFKCRALMF